MCALRTVQLALPKTRAEVSEGIVTLELQAGFVVTAATTALLATYYDGTWEEF